MTQPVTTLETTLETLAALADDKILAVNHRHGDEHAVNLTKLRAVAKDLKKNQPLAVELWNFEDSAARLLSLLICKPKEFCAADLDRMLREARTPKITDWLLNYVVKKHPQWDELRLLWLDDSNPDIAAAGWSLNTFAITKKLKVLDIDQLLNIIESEMKTAASRLQWSMNECLAQIGIKLPDHRARALDIGERLEVLKDYPTPPNCTSPFAPIWINKMVKRENS
ncbi:DNA alkylation repair protein [Corynebacterium callunae]|uniref:DNA alkylation repair protein n=1 Tax=Corynebacterium callunae TaxID=1721 RepID=UPI003982BB2B